MDTEQNFSWQILQDQGVENFNDQHQIRKSEKSALAQLLLPFGRDHDGLEVTESETHHEGTFSSPYSDVRNRFCGWKGGLTISALADTTVLLLSFGLTLGVAFGFQRDGDNAILVDGHCPTAKTWSTWLHLAVNILSTVLLSTSSYAMQCLGCPTRTEITAAHAKGKFINIGVPSLSNLLHVRRQRLVLYTILIFSSLPIHLLANSAIYETAGANSYLLTMVDDRFISQPLSNTSHEYNYVAEGFHSINTVSGGKGPQGSPKNTVVLGSNYTAQLKDLVSSQTMERLENKECIQAYSDPLSPTRRNVVAVTADRITNVTNWNFVEAVYYQSVDFCQDCDTYTNWTDPTLWVCSFVASNPLIARSCDPKKAASQADMFSINERPIAYCLSEPAEGGCQLRANISILSIVVVCAFVKTVILYSSLRNLPSDIIATVGDAIAMFLQHPEPSTEECSLLTRDDVKSKQWKPGHPFPKHWSWDNLSIRMGSGPRIIAWFRIILLMLIILLVTVVLLGIGIQRLGTTKTGLNDYGGGVSPPTDTASLWRMGFGSVNVNLLLQLPDMSEPNNVVGHVLLVNTPQLILSLIYFGYNTCWTNMLVAREWAQFGKERKGLRVSSPQGSQRHTYFLTVPFKFAVPLLVGSTLLHWLLSQSFFLARIDVYQAAPFVNTGPAVINTVGYSLIALIFLISLLGLLFIVLAAFGIFVKLNSPIPIAASCSLAISAACHPPSTEMHPELRPLMWGVVDVMEREDGTKHCSFSCEDVYSPAILPKPESTVFKGRTSNETKALFA